MPEINAATTQVDENNADEVTRDNFGRTADERTVILELSSVMAEAVAQEVKVGKHDSFTDAIVDLMSHGITERKRTRGQQEKLREQKAAAAKLAELNKYLGLNPAIVGNKEQFTAMLQKLGIAAPVK